MWSQILAFIFIFIPTALASVIVFDRKSDIDIVDSWKIGKCTYGEMYTDFNRLQCKKRNAEIIESGFPGRDMKGFWTPCLEPSCELSYTFNTSTSTSSIHRVSVKVRGYVQGNAAIQLQLGDKGQGISQLIGNLSIANRWTETSFELENLTPYSVSTPDRNQCKSVNI
jgi:molybdopterin/thiamine biosynthesis adenylyltransferase